MKLYCHLLTVPLLALRWLIQFRQGKNMSSQQKYKAVETSKLNSDDRRALLDVLILATKHDGYIKGNPPIDEELEVVDKWYNGNQKAIQELDRFVKRNIFQYDVKMTSDWEDVMGDVEEEMLNTKHSLWYDALRKAGKNG
jgi:hypothetical protein